MTKVLAVKDALIIKLEANIKEIMTQNEISKEKIYLQALQIEQLET